MKEMQSHERNAKSLKKCKVMKEMQSHIETQSHERNAKL